MTPEEYDAYVQRLVDKAPPLTPAQMDRLRILLRDHPVRRSPRS